MFTIHIDCIACHRKGEGSPFLQIERYAERTLAEACVDCHGEGFDDTLKHWKSLLSKMENETQERIFNAQKVLYEFETVKGGSPEFKKAKTLLNEARHNYSFVLLGKGVHNIEYALKLLNEANNKSEKVIAILNKNYKPKEFQTRMNCTGLCHIGIERRTVPFNDTKFSHATHVGRNQLKCLDCHSPRQNHGKTFLKICVECHHGKEKRKPKCEDCHISVKRLLEGKEGIGVKERPSNKLEKLECVDCHPGVIQKKKESFETIKRRCMECHDQSYGEKVIQWKNTYETLIKKITPRIIRLREEIERIDQRGGHTFVYRKLFGEAEFNYNLVKKGNGIHNLEYSEELIEFANYRLDEAFKQLAKKR